MVIFIFYFIYYFFFLFLYFFLLILCNFPYHFLSALLFFFLSKNLKTLSFLGHSFYLCSLLYLAYVVVPSTYCFHEQSRNLISTLLERSKQSYFTNYFQTNIKDLKNTWKGISEKLEKPISLKRTLNSALFCCH